MLTIRVRIQVLAFVIIALATTAFVGARYAGLDRLFGASGYTVKLALTDGGGLFTNGEVTYRGVAVGRVGELRLTDGGMEADLLIDDDAPPIPANSRAVVANRSAVGEQFVDLQPRTGDGPFLADGSVIPREATTVPLPVQHLLTDLDSLTASVPTEDLRTVVDELDNALRGSGANLQVLLDSTTDFTKQAANHLPQTEKLLTDGSTVLKTQVDSSQSWRRFSDNAKQFAEQLSRSDGDLRKLIATAPGAATQLSGLLRDNEPGLPILLANLLTTSHVFSARTDGLRQLLINTPKAVSAVDTAIDETGKIGLVLTFFDPMPCTKGYGDTTIRGSRELSALPFNTGAACTLEKGNPSSVRGSQNAPKGGVPPAAVPGGFGADGQPTSTSLEEMLWLRK
ncbi:MCE family protein [Amycolatopsis regifaucium]|uniref:ABC transporter substrate-binding protein n=1 Tax=Amycolatopsis regifaucium TaxID=546365 RepID=A0A154MAV9_9PSEU|nr:MlaD family protein [Amycolatopsis regifaucium]KZB81420.1 ABC transporter substrate-binding protein [Amycolatopsis regifaucium]OKA04685.1 ABC transporter substrate-binding protein [Amycolatopsis regifaucium]SFH31904.1 phospholipid/cholesterol/gamma-HCH transport system substrate-binding protein [Amycolatopsis regifaucium]